MSLFFSFAFFGNINNCNSGKLREKQNIIKNRFKGSFADEVKGESLYVKNLCQTCHGDAGRKSISNSYPNLDGQKSEYLYRQLIDIKSGERNNGMSAVMRSVLTNVSNSDFKSIAVYLSRLISLNNGKNESIVFAEGKALYKEKLCHTCHGPRGKNTIGDNYPRVAGQNEEYLVRQLLDMKNNKRNNGMTKAMSPFLKMTNELQIKKIAKYLSNLPK
jgi:cytochrome c